MPLDDAYQAGTDAALQDMAVRPQGPKRAPPRFSLWGTVWQAPKSIAAGAAEASASVVEALGGLSQVDISPDAMAAQTPEELEKIRKRARETMEKGFRENEISRSFRNTAADYLADPATAHGAQVAVSELFRVGSKAVTAAAVLGPVPGAIVSGLEEGFTTSEKLARQGVDLETRTAVGAVTAAVQAGTFALPVAGKTWPQTIGLALAGGPGGYVGQQAATRYILQQADYTLLADQYDPFDPVGLTAATVLPLGFGALGMRAARRTDAPAPEVVDAARTALLAEQQAAARPVPAEDLPGSAQHEQAYSRALEQLAAGQRVDVTDTAPAAGAERITGELSPKLAELVRLVEQQDARLEHGAEPVLPKVQEQSETAGDAGATASDASTTEGATSAKLPVEDPALDARATAIEQADPNLMVQLEGMDKPAPLGELMARLRQEITEDLQDAPLLKTAAECFLASR